MSDLEWLNFCIDEARNFGHADKAAALERIRARLTPDRERVARAVNEAHALWCAPNTCREKKADGRDWSRFVADAAIKAMEGKP